MPGTKNLTLELCNLRNIHSCVNTPIELLLVTTPFSLNVSQFGQGFTLSPTMKYTLKLKIYDRTLKK